MADQIGGGRWACPRPASSALIDLVGVDLMPLLAKSLSSTLPAGDPYFRHGAAAAMVDRMIAEGFTGRKGKGGFYRLDKGADGTRTKLALDLATGEYRPQVTPEKLPGKAERDLAALVTAAGPRRGPMPGRYWARCCPMPRCWSARRPTISSRSMTR